MSNVLKFKKLNDKAIIPEYQTAGAAGFDLHANLKDTSFVVTEAGEKKEYVIIPAGQQKIIDTGLAVEVPKGWQMEIRARSGLAANYSIAITNGVGTLDEDYRNSIKIILFNLGKVEFIVRHGDRIAQGVMMPAIQFAIEETNELSETDRKGGFGSTGT